MDLCYSTLMLSKYYEPLEVISWQRAMTLICQEKARIVEEDEENKIHSPTKVFAVPSVIQHINGFFRHERPLRYSRLNVYARDGWKCQYCGDQHGWNGLTLDHVIPRSAGGKTNWTNIVSCCYKCNRIKADRTIEDAGMGLKRAPVRPRWSPVHLLGTRTYVPPKWLPYLARAA